MSHVNSAQPLLEREEELDLLSGLLADLHSNGGKVVLVRGEAGIGKSAILREFLDGQEAESHILVGWCDDLLTPRPLGPFWDIARSEPSLLESLATTNPSSVLETVMDLLTRALRSTILVIEDTQWVDEATLDAINHLGRRIAHTNSLLILTFRDTEVDYDHPLRNVLGHLPVDRVVRIKLGGLSLGAVSLLIEGSGLDPEDVFAATDGNPFLTNEMATDETGTVPSSVRDSVLARVNKLSADAREILRVLSVIPEAVPRSDVEVLAGGTHDALIECEHRGLLDVGRGFVVFHHELIRRAVEASLTETERRRINRQVLSGLPEDADPARLAHHASQAGDVDRLVEAALRAALAAAAVGSHREAVEHFRQLGPYIDRLPPENKGMILNQWAWEETYLSYAGDVEAIHLNDLALAHFREVGNERWQSRVLADGALFHEWVGRRVDAERYARQAIDVLGANPSGSALAHALDTQAYLAMMAGDAATTLDLVDRTLEAAGPNVDERLVIRALVHKGAAVNITRYPKGRDILDEARQRAEAVGDWREVHRALVCHGDPAIDNRDLETAVEYEQMAIEANAAHERWGAEAYAKAQYSRIFELQGEWAQAEDLARELSDWAGVVQEGALPVLSVIDTRRGRDSARETMERAWEVAVDSAEFQRMAPAAAAFAEYGWITGDTDIPIDELRRVIDSGPNTGWAWLAGSIAFWLWKLGELDEIPEGIAEPYRLIMEGDPLAAAEIFEQLGIPYERAITLSHGDTKAQLEALQILDDLGATAVADKLRQELRDQGVSVPRRRARKTDHRTALTARQTEVLSLLAEDLSNIEIADRLFLSPRTVEHHVAAVMSKLNASTRGEAVEMSADQGLIPEGA